MSAICCLTLRPQGFNAHRDDQCCLTLLSTGASTAAQAFFTAQLAAFLLKHHAQRQAEEGDIDQDNELQAEDKQSNTTTTTTSGASSSGASTSLPAKYDVSNWGVEIVTQRRGLSAGFITVYYHRLRSSPPRKFKSRVEVAMDLGLFPQVRAAPSAPRVLPRALQHLVAEETRERVMVAQQITAQEVSALLSPLLFACLHFSLPLLSLHASCPIVTTPFNLQHPLYRLTLSFH